MAKAGNRGIDHDMMAPFTRLCRSRNRWQVWQDFVMMVAICISNRVDKGHFDSREKQFTTIASQYSQLEMKDFGEMFSALVGALEANPNQDFLGDTFMRLELGNHWKGQFFTPYDVCRMMAEVTYGADLKDSVEKKGWFSVNDCACGAGATLIAFANLCRDKGLNFQTSVLFVAQDVDLVAGLMCYIQLSLLGCPGYVVIENTLTNPVTSYDGRGLIPKPGENIWYTPLYHMDVWHWRRIFWQTDMLFRNSHNAGKLPEPPVTEVDKSPPCGDGEQLSFF